MGESDKMPWAGIYPLGLSLITCALGPPSPGPNSNEITEAKLLRKIQRAVLPGVFLGQYLLSNLTKGSYRASKLTLGSKLGDLGQCWRRGGQ